MVKGIGIITVAMLTFGCGPTPVAVLRWGTVHPTPAPRASPPHLLLEGVSLQAEGKRVRLRGVNVCSLEFDHEGTIWALGAGGGGLLARLADPTRWNANVVRVPVNQQWFIEDEAYRVTVERVLDDAAVRGLYVILDDQWEHAGRTDPYEKNILEVPTFGEGNTTENFWWTALSRWSNRGNLLIDLINEPHGRPENEVREALQTLVDAIRLSAPSHLIVLGGPDWGHSVAPWAKAPLQGTGLLYSAHQYLPWDEASSFETKWREPSTRVPVLIGEFLADTEHLDYAQTLIDAAESAPVNGWLPWAIGCGLSEEVTTEPAATIAAALRRLH